MSPMTAISGIGGIGGGGSSVAKPPPKGAKPSAFPPHPANGEAKPSAVPHPAKEETKELPAIGGAYSAPCVGITLPVVCGDYSPRCVWGLLSPLCVGITRAMSGDYSRGLVAIHHDCMQWPMVHLPLIYLWGNRFDCHVLVRGTL